MHSDLQLLHLFQFADVSVSQPYRSFDTYAPLACTHHKTAITFKAATSTSRHPLRGYYAVVRNVISTADDAPLHWCQTLHHYTKITPDNKTQPQPEDNPCSRHTPLDALPYFMELYYFKVAQFLQINCTRRRSFINKYTYYHAA
jgi:hypothetical protein